MNAIWLSLMIYAVVEAVAAAYRVRQRRQAISDQPFVSRAVQSSPRSRQPAAGAALQLSSDLDRLIYPSLPDTSELLTLQQNPSADLNLPLAVSLSVSELVHPKTRSHSTEQPDLDSILPDSAGAELEAAKPTSPEHQSVLAEVSQLDTLDSEDAIAQFQRHLNHPDDIVRAAIVFEFGETAAQYQGAKAAEAKAVLMQLNQDPNPNIRTQVVLALAKIDPIIL